LKYERKKNSYISLLRAVLCIAVFFYHLGLLKGGYLAVCFFFVISGYLCTESMINRWDESLRRYYVGKFKRLYLPLIVVIFISVFAVSLIPDINWITLKPETTSSLFAYNNFWQLSVNNDYFARHSDSPFMHLWYIAILIQFELIYPFIYKFLRWVENKVNDSALYIISAAFAIFLGVFIYFVAGGNKMAAYFNSFARFFSLFAGFAAFLLFKRFKLFRDRTDKHQKSYIVAYAIMLIVMFVLFFLVDSDSDFFGISMIFVTILSCFLIAAAYGIVTFRFSSKVLDFVANISYEIYLVQYPVIYIYKFLAQKEAIGVLDVFIILVITVAVSYVINYALSIVKEKSTIKLIVLALLCVAMFVGCYEYIAAKDNTEDMKALEAQLAYNSEVMKAKQEEYAAKMNEKNEEWQQQINDYEEAKANIEETVKNLPVCFIGDSVLLGASNELYNTFPNSYVDGQVSRQAMNTIKIVDDLRQSGMLGNPVVFHLGTNGCPLNVVWHQLIEACGDRDVFFINITNEKQMHVNEHLQPITEEYDNVYYIDWQAESEGHDEYFRKDKIHLVDEGKVAYAEMILREIKDVYLERLEEEHSIIVNERNQNLSNEIAVYGNDMLLNMYDYLEDYITFSAVKIYDTLDFFNLYSELRTAVSNDSLQGKLIFAFDSNDVLTISQYADLVELLKNYKVFVVAFDDENIALNVVNPSHVTVLDFSGLSKDHPELLSPDKVHLSPEGNAKAAEMIYNIIKDY